MESKTYHRTTILISKQSLNALAPLACCQQIGEGKSIPGTFHFRNKEYVITGSMSSALEGYSVFFGCEVIDLILYNRPLKPLPYGKHGDEVDRGERERGYTGMLIKYGTRQLVCLDQVDFKANHEVKQLSIF